MQQVYVYLNEVPPKRKDASTLPKRVYTEVRGPEMVAVTPFTFALICQATFKKLQ